MRYWMIYQLLSPFEHRIRPISGPIRKSNIFSVFAVYVTHKFSTFFAIFCSWKGDKNKTELASILLNRLAVLKTVKDSPCRLVHHRLSTACLFIRIVACSVLSLYMTVHVELLFVTAPQSSLCFSLQAYRASSVRTAEPEIATTNQRYAIHTVTTSARNMEDRCENNSLTSSMSTSTPSVLHLNDGALLLVVTVPKYRMPSFKASCL